jgi:hypothetical protein
LVLAMLCVLPLVVPLLWWEGWMEQPQQLCPRITTSQAFPVPSLQLKRPPSPIPTLLGLGRGEVPPDMVGLEVEVDTMWRS